MKVKKILVLIGIISIILLIYPMEVFAWLDNLTYESCNNINRAIAWSMETIAFIVGISYITIAIRYIRSSNIERKQKIKNVLIWLIITIIQIAILICGSLLVTQIGMEMYVYPTRREYNATDISINISNIMRICAFISLIAYVITSLIYYFKSKQENNKKIKKIVKWQIVTVVGITILLIIAKYI